MEDLFEVTLDFDKNEDKPERIFKTMASLLEDLQNIDKMLCETLPIKIETKTYLEKVENGSITAFLENVVKMLDDEALENGEFKKVAGRYIKACKYLTLEYFQKLKEKKEEGLQKLQDDIFQKSKDYELGKLQIYKTVPKIKLAENLTSLNKTFGNLTIKEAVKIKQGKETIKLEYNPDLSIKTFEKEITEKIIKTQNSMILKIKKADYLGDSQWDFKISGKSIKANITDLEWLKKFQATEIEAKPQDSLDCIVEIETRYDNNNKEIESNHEIIKVNKVVPANQSLQRSFNYDEKLNKLD